MTDKKAVEVPTGNIQRVHIDKVIPYWRNPRQLSQEAVEAVGQSITEYGYAQPIVVDSEFSIIIGHTRYTALRRLGVTELDVLVADHLSPTAVKQLRVIDNRSGEYAFWDFEKLMGEVGEQDSSLFIALFPELAKAEDLDAAVNEIVVREGATSADWDRVEPEVEFVCPVCFDEFEVHVTREDIMNGLIDPRKDA